MGNGASAGEGGQLPEAGGGGGAPNDSQAAPPPPKPHKYYHEQQGEPPRHGDSTHLLDDVHGSSSDDSSDSEGDSGQELALELFELLPYCNMGDSHTDNLVQSSLESGNVDFLTVDDNGNTLLMIACQYRLANFCSIMINNGVDVNTKNALGASPLHFACADGTDSLEVAELLLRNGANPSSVEASTGCTPLHYAALVPNVEYVQLLLRSGANPLAEDQEDYLPLDYAKDVYLSEHIAVLTSAGTAKRQGADAYDAFLDNLCVTSGGGESLHTTPLPSYHGGSGGDDIDNLLSELDMNGSLTSSSPSTRAATGGNQSKATEQELQALLADIFTREGVGAATSNKKSLQRSTTVCVLDVLLSSNSYCCFGRQGMAV